MAIEISRLSENIQLFFGRLPLLTILDGDKIPINIFLGWGQVKILKIIFSPYFVNISDGDEIPNDMIFGWGQDRDFEVFKPCRTII